MKSSSSSGHWSTSAHAIEEDDWEAMFHPHYSIDTPRHKRPARRRGGASPFSMLPTTTSTTIVEAPSLPYIDILAEPSNDSLFPQQSASSSSSSTAAAHHQQQHYDPLWADRMDVLRTIREGCGSGMYHHHQAPLPSSAPPHHFSEKSNGFANFWEKLKQDVKQERPPSTIDLEETTDPSEKATRKNKTRKVPFRHSFLLFAFGFVFPPLWIVGAMYAPQHTGKAQQQQEQQRQSSEGQAVDLQWRRRSRNAFFTFITTVLALLILTIVLSPATVGWRISPQLPNAIAHY